MLVKQLKVGDKFLHTGEDKWRKVNWISETRLGYEIGYEWEDEPDIEVVELWPGSVLVELVE